MLPCQPGANGPWRWQLASVQKEAVYQQLSSVAHTGLHTALVPRRCLHLGVEGRAEVVKTLVHGPGHHGTLHFVPARDIPAVDDEVELLDEFLGAVGCALPIT